MRCPPLGTVVQGIPVYLSVSRVIGARSVGVSPSTGLACQFDRTRQENQQGTSSGRRQLVEEALHEWIIVLPASNRALVNGFADLNQARGPNRTWAFVELEALVLPLYAPAIRASGALPAAGFRPSPRIGFPASDSAGLAANVRLCG